MLGRTRLQPIVMSLIRKLLLLLGSIPFLFLLFGLWQWSSVVEEEVEFQSGDLVLKGTLRSPRWGDSAPAFVMVHGSGPVTRRSMVVYAWLYALKGYTTLAYDKRGTGASEGDPHEWREFSFDDLAADSVAAYKFLQSLPRIDRNKVGFFGGSQGGWVVSLAANQVESPAFITMVSASVSTVAEDRVFQRQAQVRHLFSEEAAAEASELIRADHLVTRTGLDYEKYTELWDAFQNRAWFEEVYRDEAPEPVDSISRQWEKTILDFDPQPLLRKIDAPTLWLFGDPSLDRSAPVSLSVERLNAEKDSGACYRVIQINDTGHTLEPEGDIGLYKRLKMRFSLVRDIYRWIDTLDSIKACS